MTNKEAIKGLKALSKEFSGYKPNEEMFDMAIKALELVTINSDSNEIKVTNCNYKDTIYRQDAIDAVGSMLRRKFGIGGDLAEITLAGLPSAQPEYYDYSDIEHTWNYYAEENDINLTANAKQIKDAMWVGYRKGKESAQPETAKRIVAKSRSGMALWYQCDMCNEPIDRNDLFCRGCGRRLVNG